MFEDLVAEGEKFEERTDERLAEMREKATGTWNKVEKVFDDRVGRALHVFNVPTPQGYRRLVKARPRADGDHQEAVRRGRDPPQRASARRSHRAKAA